MIRLTRENCLRSFILNEAKILIIGAGALGITCAYHLQLGGAKISFLVRPNRVDALSRPQKLYCYNDHSIKLLEGYRVFTDASELQGQHFDFVMLTLDGATCRSAEGVALLSGVGKALAGTGSNLVICGVGIGLYEHVRDTTGFAENNLLEGSMKMFAYQVGRPNAPQPSSNVELHDSADIAFLSFPDRIGFFLANRPKQSAQAFAQAWKNSGVALCKLMPPKVYATFSNTFFPFTVACELTGWNGTDALVNNREMWQLCCDAQREIMGLKQHGFMGKIFSWLMNNAKLEKMMRDMERTAAPMGFTQFNRFHHGGKVLEQDVQIMANCAAAGEQQGRDMSAVNKLLALWRERNATR